MASTAGDEVLAPRVAPATISRALQARFEERREKRRLDNGMTTLVIRALRGDQEPRAAAVDSSRASASTSAAGPSVVDERGDGAREEHRRTRSRQAIGYRRTVISGFETDPIRSDARQVEISAQDLFPVIPFSEKVQHDLFPHYLFSY